MGCVQFFKMGGYLLNTFNMFILVVNVILFVVFFLFCFFVVSASRICKPAESQKQINLIIYYTKFKTSNIIVKNNTNSPKTPFTQNNVV